MQQIIIRVMACGLVMVWSWIGVLGTEARNQQRKAKEGLATSCHSSNAFLQQPRRACHSAGMLLLWPVPWEPFSWHSASLLESLRGRSYPPQWSSHDCCKIWETCPDKHLKKLSLPWHWTSWGFFYSWADVSGLLLHFSSRDFQWQKLKTFNGNWTLSRKCCLEWSWLAWKIFWMPNSAKLKCFLSAILW